MADVKEYNALVVVTPQDFVRTAPSRRRLIDNLPARRIIFVGSAEVGALLADEKRMLEAVGAYIDETGKSILDEKVGFIDENELIPFECVYNIICDILKDILGQRKLPRGIAGWYYQQFLKLEYARHCSDEYYMTWDGDTVPCAPFSMFAEDGETPYLDLKQEYHEGYFSTISKLFPGFRKVIGPSFISEHMLFKRELVCEMLREIEAGTDSELSTGLISEKVGKAPFYETILRAIPAEKIQDMGFSEFETFGTYVAFRRPTVYKLREWHSFRLGAEFFHPELMTDNDYSWLSKDFQAISFEKNQTVREDHENLFNNPKYQEKLSARRMLEIAQEEFTEGYKEEWNTISSDGAEIDRSMVVSAYEAGQNSRWDEMYSIISQGLRANYQNYELYILLGEYILLTKGNADMAYLCYENALHFCNDANDRKQIEEMAEGLKEKYSISVRPISIVIVSWNNADIMQDCIRSIRRTVPAVAREIVVVDNASNDGISQWLSSQLDIRLIQNSENAGFGRGSNQGLEAASEGNDIFFLNNDTIVTPNSVFWLRMALYDTDENVFEQGETADSTSGSAFRAAGCCTNYEGSGQPPLKTFDTIREYLLFANENNTPMNEPYEERSWLSGFALAFRRCVLDKIGGFDPEYGMGYFEDTDLCERARRAGCRLVMCKNSYIYHYGSKSFGLQYEKAREMILVNRQRFIDKWGYDPYEK